MTDTNIINTITFYGFSIAILVFALIAIFSRKIIYTLIFSALVFFFSAGLFFSLGAGYNAVVQIMIYGIAVPMIFLFAVMFTSKKEDKFFNFNLTPKFFLAFLSVVCLTMLLCYSTRFAIYINSSVADFFNVFKPEFSDFDSVVLLANTMYSVYNLPLIMFGLILVACVIGISVLNFVKEVRGRKHGD